MKFYKKLIILLILTSTGILAQTGSIGLRDARSTAMGNTYTANASGIYAIGVNPANLAHSENHRFEIVSVLPIPQVNFGFGNDFITVEDYNYFFGGKTNANGEITGRYLDDNDKQKFLGLFDGGNAARSSFSTSLLSFSFYHSRRVGAFAFSINDRVSMRAQVPVDMFRFALYGNEVGSVYKLDDIELNSSYLRDYSLSYARDLTKFLKPSFLESISGGISLKLIHGFFYTGVDRNNSKIETLDDKTIKISADSRYNIAASPDFGIVYDFEDDTSKSSNAGAFNSPAGTGFGFDIGFSAKVNEIWNVGLAVTDIGSVSWDNETVEYVADGEYIITDITEDNLGDTLENKLQGEGSYSNGFSTSLPTAMRLGVGFKLHEFLESDFPGEMRIALDYNQGFNNVAGNSTTPRVSIGAEYRPKKIIPIRTGFSFGGEQGFHWAFGFGIDAGLVEFDLSTYDMNGILAGNSAKSFGVSFGSRWKF
jgi:hypothetical protein